MPSTDVDLDIVRLIQLEYAEFPGMALTKPQARRLFGIEPGKCDHILDDMVEAKLLRRTPGQTYVLNRARP